MKTNTYSPVIVLLNADSSDKNYVKWWFEKSRFHIFEATDVFEALEEVSDFTVRDCPDVILLEVNSPPHYFSIVRDMVNTSHATTEMPILAFSKLGEIDPKEYSSFKSDLAELEIELDKLIPEDRRNNRLPQML